MKIKSLLIGLLLLLPLTCSGDWYEDAYLMMISAGDGFPSGRTFVAIYDEGLNADISRGSPTATFAASRDATHPATYFDASGVMQKTTTSNVGRLDYGFYDTSGWTAFTHAGVMIESASTNYLTYGIFSAGTTIGTGWTDDHDTDTQATYSLVDVSSQFNVGTTVQSQRIVYTGVVADSDAYSQMYQTTAAASFAQDDNVTVSLWIKGSISGMTFYLRYDERDNLNAAGTVHSSANLASSISSTEWRRFTYSTPTVDADCDRIGPRILIASIDNGDTIDIQVACFQAEKTPFATSFIPTTTASLTRNLETLKYPISGNRTAAVESCVVKLAPEFAEDNGVTRHITATDTKNRRMRFNTTNDVAIQANQTDSTTCVVEDLINDSWTANTEMTLAYAIQHSSPYIAGYYQGIADGTNETADDFTNPAWGTYFNVGSANDDTSQLNGTILGIAFFNRVLSDAEMLDLHNKDWRTLR